MKQIEFNPLQKELARSQQAGPHPDSDLLTAFSEGTLLERGRQDVFAHLATCAECRELLSVATAAAPGTQVVPKPFLLRRSAGPPLRVWLPWASVAAGILIVCSADLVYRQKLELKQHATTAAENAPGIPPSTNQQAPQPPLAAMPNAVAQSSAPSRTHSAFANAETARSFSENTVSSVSARPHWRIDSAGHAERSFGAGVWQQVLPNESARMRVVSVIDAAVWVGGENARLYRSSDNGNTWNLVPLPMKNGSVPMIVHIRFQTPRTGTVEAADGTSWTTADGGVTWN